MILLLLSSRKKRGLSLNKMVMIGRQNLHLKETELRECFEKFKYSGFEMDHILNHSNSFSEGLFSYLGAKNIESIDASNFEDATIIHDMNIPLREIEPSKGEFDLVLDSGTLEHVFNFPQAIKNCMDLAKIGGHFVGIYPCNNFFGHGFYQFSSELFYRTFSEKNGFKIIDVILFVDESDTKFYSVPDTNSVYQRLQFTNTKPVYIYVLAEKVSSNEIFKTYPLQMDYSQIKWKGKINKIATQKKSKKVKKVILPNYLKNIIKAIFNIKTEDDRNFRKPYLSTYKLR